MTNCRQIYTIGITEWCALAAEGSAPPVTVCLEGNSMMPLIRRGKDPVTIAALQHPLRVGDVVLLAAGADRYGEQKDMRPYFQMAHCVVHPSYYPEGMSNVLLEAAASGRPVIATDRSGCRETVDAGKSGYLIPIKDEEALVAALEDFLGLTWEEREALGHAGRMKMEHEFDRQMVVQKYMDALGA